MRRVVTGASLTGGSRVTQDGATPHVVVLEGYPGVELEQLWRTDGSGLLETSGEEPPPPEGIYPPPGGSRFECITYPAGFGVAPPDDDDASPFARLLMHRTSTVDYGVVIEGELTLVLEEGSETVLAAGDAVVQNGVTHGWRNRGPEPAVVAFVLIGQGADEPRHPRGGID